MPQLDKLSFLNQLIWFFFFYIIFYYLMIKTYIPTIGRSLKLRAKLLSNLTEQNALKLGETKTLVTTAEALIANTQNIFDLSQKYTSFHKTVLNILDNNPEAINYKNVYVKEASKILAKKNILLKKWKIPVYFLALFLV